MADENIDIRVRLRESARFNAQTRKSAGEVDNLGDQAAQAARKFRQLNRASSGTRVNLGLMSTRLRGSIFLFGAAALGIERYTGAVVSLGEAATSVGGGLGAAGAVGLTALAQGGITASLALSDLGEALGGNEEALKRLQPEVLQLFDTLQDATEQLRLTSATSFLPGATRGAMAAMQNLPVILRNTALTGQAMGSLFQEAGEMLGSADWARDLKTIGTRNVDILESLGTGTLHLADAARHLLVEAGPLAQWLANVAEKGAAATEEFFETKRQTGELAEFFRRARRDITLLGQGLGAGGRGIINLFGASDVNGTETLRNFREIMERFERWSKSPMVQRGGLGEALVGEVEDAADDIVVAIAEGFVRAGPKAAEVFWNAFWKSSVEGKLLLGAAVLWKSGVFRLLGRRVGGAAGGAIGSALGGGRGSPRNPMYVIVLNDVPGGGARGGRRGGPRTGPRGTPGGARGAVRGGAAAVAGTLLLDELLPEGKVRDALFGDNPEAKVKAALDAQLRRQQRPAAPGRPNPLDPGDPFRNPFQKVPRLPPIKLENEVNLDGKAVYRNQRYIDMQDKRRFGRRR